jgi:hypothetical protein
MGYTVITVCFAVTAAHRHVEIDAGLRSLSTDPEAVTPPFLKQAEGAFVTIQIALAPVRDRIAFEQDRAAFLDSDNVKWIRDNT